MQKLWALYSKEVKGHFTAPLTYILTALFNIIVGWIFFNILVLSKEQVDISLDDQIIRPVFSNINTVLLFVLPLITMRAFSEEKKLKTIELLFLSPLKNVEIVLAKFLSIVTVVSFILLFTLVLPVILYSFNVEDWNIVWASYAGIILNALSFIALGLFCSSLTENQVLSAIMSYVGTFILILLSWSSYVSSNYIVGEIFSYLSHLVHYEGWTHGMVKSSDIVYYCSFIFSMFFLTLKSLNVRNW